MNEDLMALDWNIDIVSWLLENSLFCLISIEGIFLCSDYLLMFSYGFDSPFKCKSENLHLSKKRDRCREFLLPFQKKQKKTKKKSPCSFCDSKKNLKQILCHLF